MALIEHLDAGIGRVLKALEEAGLAKDTLVVFNSDNGGDVGARNGPVRAGKGTMYEGGLKVAACARWPGRIAPGSRSNLLATTMDLLPTIAEAAGAKIDHEIDGMSFLPALLGRPLEWPARDLFFRRRELFGKAGGTIECLRRGDWKLLRSKPGGAWELYNLADDPKEQNNLAASQPAKLAELSAAMGKQLARYEKVAWQP